MHSRNYASERYLQMKEDRYFIRNTAGISLTEFFWGFGMPIIMESTFIQIFLSGLGASRFIIGLVPAILYAGLSVFGLASGFLTSHLTSKKKVLILTHIVASMPILLLGLYFLIFGYVSGSVPVFFLAYTLFSSLIGLAAPLWQNFIVKIFSEKKSVQGLSVMWIAQTIGKILSSLFLAAIINKFGTDSFSTAMIFLAVGILFLAGSFMFLIIREDKSQTESKSREKNFVRFHLDALKEIRGNKKFILYLLSDIESFAIIGIISFYAIYAVDFCGISPAAASGLFVAFIYIGGLLANIILGWFNFLTLKNKLFLTKILALTGALLLVLWNNIVIFLLASFLMGIARSNRNLLYAVAVKKLSGAEDATTHFSIAYVIMLPVSIGLPLFNGIFLDKLENLGAASYRYLFIIMALLIGLSILIILRIDFSSEKQKTSRHS